MAAALPVGLGFAFFIPALSAGLQDASPVAFRGRVMATFAIAHLGLGPLSGLSAGILADAWGERTALTLFVLGAVSASTPRARRRSTVTGAEPAAPDPSRTCSS